MDKADGLAGIFPVLPTPFGRDGAISHADLERLFEFIRKTGAHGFTYPGVASEVRSLGKEERIAATKTLGALLGGSGLDFILGASASDVHDVIELCNEGSRNGAHYFMITAQHPLGDAGVDRIVEFYRTVSENIDGEIMLQNAPAPAGSGLSVRTIATVCNAVDRIRYVKEETMPCGQRISGLKSLMSGDKRIFGGAGARYFLDELNRGAVGTLPAAEIADIHVQMYEAYRRKDMALARRLYNVSLPLLVFQQVFRMSATKEVLKMRGVIAENILRESGPVIDDVDRVELQKLLGPLWKYFIV